MTDKDIRSASAPLAFMKLDSAWDVALRLRAELYDRYLEKTCD